jgi:predicted RNA-binding protein
VCKVFKTDGLALNCVNRLKMAAQFGTLTRTEVEIMCTTRPETIDGLWKLNNEWHKSKRLLAIPEQRELIVTTSTAFYRREVLRYLNEILPAYAPTKRKVILYRSSSLSTPDSSLIRA